MRLTALFSFVSTVVASTDNCLVVSDIAKLDGYSQSLSALNCVTIKSSDKSIHLSEYGNYIYSNLVFLIEDVSKFKLRVEAERNSRVYESTANELQSAHLLTKHRHDEAHGESGGLSLSEILDFVDQGGNVLLGLAGGIASPSRDLSNLLNQLGGFKLGKSMVRDFFHKQHAASIMSSPSLPSEPWITNVGIVAFSGARVLMTNPENKNVFSILRASETCHDGGAVGGIDISLVSVHQTLSNGRVSVAGSLEMFSNFVFEKNAYNFEWMKNLVGWTLRGDGLVRMRDFNHHKQGETESPRMYREKDLAVVGMIFEEKKNGAWIPYIANDIQIEYTMLDPHLRQNLQHKGNGHYELKFQIPDVYGIFKFHIDHQKRGHNQVLFEQVAPVRNFKHNDYDRFLFCAYPYYATCFVTLALVSVFAFAFINHKDRGWKNPDKELRYRE